MITNSKLKANLYDFYQRVSLNKFVGKNKQIFLLLFGFILMAGLVFATTIITETNIDTPTADVVNISTERVNISGRPLVTYLDKSVTVCSSGCDYTTIQDAVNNAPYFLSNDYNINVGPGTYPEHVLVKNIYGNDYNGENGGAFRITGNKTNPETVNIKSVDFSGCGGTYFYLQGVTLYEDSEFNELVGVGSYRCSEVSLQFLIFNESLTNGVVSYGGGSHVDISRNLTMNLSGSGIGFYVKHGGSIGSEPTSIAQVFGNVSIGFQNVGGIIQVPEFESYYATTEKYLSSRGLLYVYDKGVIYDISKIPNDLNVTGNMTIGNNLNMDGIITGLDFSLPNDENLLLAFNFNNQSIEGTSAGSNVYDSSRHARVGNMTTAFANYEDNSSYDGSGAMEFDGSQKIEVNNLSYNNYTDDFSYSFWIYMKSTDTTKRDIIRQDFAPYIYTELNERIVFQLHNGSVSFLTIIDSDDGFTYDSWFYATYTYDGNSKTAKAYLNGVLVETDDISEMGGDFQGSQTLEIGEISNDFIGFLEDFRIYKTALTQEQINTIYATNSEIDNPRWWSISFKPLRDKVYDLGSSTLRWLNGYFINLDVAGNVTIGTSTIPTNITMYSPDGTEYSCGIADGGAWSCG